MSKTIRQQIGDEALKKLDTMDKPESKWGDINEQTPEEIKFMADADEMLEGQARPTSQQVAWVFCLLYTSLMSPCSFRRLIYNRMGFGATDYMRLQMAGGLSLNNAITEEGFKIEAEQKKIMAELETGLIK